MPNSAEIACALSLGEKALHKMILNKFNKNKKQFEKDKQTIKSFDKLYRKTLQDNLIDRNEFESLCKVFTEYFDQTWNEFFFKIEHKNKIELFS